MYASLLSSSGRALRLSSLALAALGLAACDNDRPVGPNATTPNTPSPALVAKGGTLTISIVDQNNKPATTLAAQFTVAGSNGIAYFAVDNGPADADPTIGTIRMNGLLGTYKVCQTVAPTDYVLANPACQPVNITPGLAATLQFVDLTVGHLSWTVVLKYGLQPTGYLGGTSFTGFVNPGVLDTIVDNSPMDLDPAPGKFEIKVPSGGYNLCPMATPKKGFTWPGPLGPNGGCIGLPVPPGQTTFVADYGAVPEFSAFWWVQDLNFQNVGPSTYEVKGGNSGTFFATVDDQGSLDLDPELGKVWLQLPEDGDYQVCQTVAPPKLQIAVTPCAKITVTKGLPAYVTTFQSAP